MFTKQGYDNIRKDKECIHKSKGGGVMI